MNNVRPGDIAKIRGCTISPQSDGGVVQVEVQVEHRTQVTWKCRAVTGFPAMIVSKNPDGTLKIQNQFIMPGKEIYAADRVLKRIDPKTDPDAVPAPPEHVDSVV